MFFLTMLGLWAKTSMSQSQHRVYDKKDYILFEIDSSDINGKVSKRVFISQSDSTRRFSCYYWDNGLVMLQGFNHKKLKDGIWQYYFPTGQLKIEENYLEGIKNGDSRYYNANGKKIKTETYKNGKLQRVIIHR